MYQSETPTERQCVRCTAFGFEPNMVELHADQPGDRPGWHHHKCAVSELRERISALTKEVADGSAPSLADVVANGEAAVCPSALNPQPSTSAP